MQATTPSGRFVLLHRRWLVVLTALTAVACRAAAPTPGPPVRGETTELRPLCGRLLSLDHQRGLRLIGLDGKESITPIDGWISLNLADSADPGARLGPAPLVVRLANGDCLSGALTAGGEETLRLSLAEGPTVELPLTEVTAVERSGLSRPTLPNAGEADIVVLANGDRLTGLVSAWSARGLTLAPAPGAPVTTPERTLDWERVQVVIPAKVGDPAVLPSQRLALRLTLTSGCVLTAVECTVTPKSADLTLLGGMRIVGLPTHHIRRVEPVNGPVVPLSGLSPIDCDHSPAYQTTPERPPMRDRNVIGGPLQVAGQRAQTGWGMASRSRLVFRLEGAYRRFVTGVGIDDAAAAGGCDPVTGRPFASATFRVVVDGQVRYERTGVTVGQRLPRVELDITGARSLSLELDHGPHGSIQNWGDWLEPRLIK